MAADNFSATLNLQYTPPGAPANSGVAALASGGTYNAGQAGTIDVPTTASVDDVIPVPFGSVAAGKLVVIRNGLAADVGVRLNGAGSNTFNLPPGGEFAYIAPAAPSAVPLTSVSLVVTAVPSVLGRVMFYVFGD